LITIWRTLEVAGKNADREKVFMVMYAMGGYMVMAAGMALGSVGNSSNSDQQSVARLDLAFQAAVKVNDVKTMDLILGKDMVLVLGNGTINTREQLLQEARDKVITYERQDEDPGTQTVRVWGDTAVVTALLWVKGVNNGVAFNRRLWFSDTYARTPEGWRYVFGQASLHLPET
jgi:ketosteroid isomerase-like protein